MNEELNEVVNEVVNEDDGVKQEIEKVLEVEDQGISRFIQATNFNTEGLMKQKGTASYIPWASAYSVFRKVYPKGNYKFKRNKNGGFVFEERIPEINGEGTKLLGYYVAVEMTDGELNPMIHETELPIMDFKNKANMNFTIMEVNKAKYRCLTKGCAMFGVALPAYAGEEYYQWEFGDEIDQAKEQILAVMKEILELNKDMRAKVVEIVGYKGNLAGIKKLEEASEKLDKLEKLLEDVKATKNKSKKEVK